MTQFGSMFGNTTANKINAQQAGGDANMVTDDDVGRDQSLSAGLSDQQLTILMEKALQAAKKGNQQELKKSFAEVATEQGAEFFMSFLKNAGLGFIAKLI